LSASSDQEEDFLIEKYSQKLRQSSNSIVAEAKEDKILSDIEKKLPNKKLYIYEEGNDMDNSHEDTPFNVAVDKLKHSFIKGEEPRPFQSDKRSPDSFVLDNS
jgi:hypothetical protein